jgi:fatty acid desaturase
MTVIRSVVETGEEPHQPHWVSQAAFPVISTAFGVTQVALAVALFNDMVWLSVLLVPIAGHLMHGHLVAFHETSHGLLGRNRLLNEISGVFLGVFSFMSFSLYRAAHQTHHVHLATERDEELWPFVGPGTSRRARIAAAILELTAGFLFTPILFLRSFLRKGSPIRNTRVRRRIWAELVLMIVVWTAVVAGVAYWNFWKYFVWIYLVPAIIAGDLQSWRKYVEHVGLTGCTVNGSTRSVVADNWGGRFVSFTLLHEPYHGVHHHQAGLTHAELPLHAAMLESSRPDEPPPFRATGMRWWT